MDCVDKYILIMLINEMRSGDVTLSWVHISLVLKNFKNLRKVKAFNVLGMKMIALSHGLNILLKKMPLFVYHAFSFISQVDMTDKMHSQLTDLRVGRKLKMVKVVLLFFIWGKILTPLIELPIKCV